MSQLADTEVKEGEFLPVIAAQSGVGKFSAIELNKQLAGKKAGINLYVKIGRASCRERVFPLV